MFQDREEAAKLLADKLRRRDWRHPLVLGIPRGGVVVGAVLARALGAELDIVLARKMRAPQQPELAIGAIAENGEVFLNDIAQVVAGCTESYLLQERRAQMDEIKRRIALFRPVRPAASMRGRSLILTDDGIATGATMMAALQTVRSQKPKEVVVAVPVASPHQLESIGKACDEVICLAAPVRFQAVGQFYRDFRQIEDEEVLELLRAAATDKTDEAEES
jgi:predicted phosphoribosyltransferase